MGGQDATDTELTDQEIVSKLKKILQCLESEEGKVCRKVEDGDNWFSARKEKLRVPKDARQEELKLLLEEKNKKNQTDNLNKVPETVINTIYPTIDKGANETIKQDTIYNKKVNKPGDVREESISINDDAQITLRNITEYGLLQGPYVEPFTLEFTMGKILTGCECIKRNGLQGDCRKRLCKVNKHTCTRLPLPICVPSGYGRLKPKETKVFMGEISHCSKESEISNVKTASVQRKREPVRKDYIDSPAFVPATKCKVHVRGKYYIRPSRRNKITQTVEIESPVESPSVYEACPPVEIVAARHKSS